MILAVAIISALFAYNSLGIYLLRVGNQPAVAPQQTAWQNTLNIDQANLIAYFESKGSRKINSDTSFAQLLNVIPNNILGETSSVSVNESVPRSTQSATLASPKTIVLLGDSMIDTLGRELIHLNIALNRYFPETAFRLHNYGVGASNIESGLTRITESYNYLGEYKPSILSLNPDIIVVESFAYNHWTDAPSDIDRHWLSIAKLIETIKSKNPHTKIVLAATIAPYCPTYTDGSANLPPERKQLECRTVIAYLQNLVNFAISQQLPLADAYHDSLTGAFGKPTYINQTDHIHPSVQGMQLFSEKIARAISQIY